MFKLVFFFFFFQAEDGIRDLTVTGVQTCALPIYEGQRRDPGQGRHDRQRRRRPRASVPGPERASTRRNGRAASLHQYLRQPGGHPVPPGEEDGPEGRRRGVDRARDRGRVARALLAMARMRVRLTFPPALIQEPIVYRLGKDFDIVINIRRADVETDHGWMVLEPGGDEGGLEGGGRWVQDRGVQVDPIERDVIVP